MAYTILSESYGRRLPKITAEADSTDDLTSLGTNYAEGSTCTVGEDEYVLDKVGGWVIRGSGGGGGDFIANVVGDTEPYTLDKTYGEIYEAIDDNLVIIRMTSNGHKDVGIVEQIYPYDDGGVTKYQMSIRWLPAWQFNPGTADSYPEENMD